MQVSFSILRANGEVGKVYTAESDVVTFGRSDECDVQLDDGYVSSRHAEILCIDGRFYLQDLKSTNGTWLKESRVDGRIPIADSAIIEFGKGGPKVRVVSLLGPGAIAAISPAAESFVTGGTPSSKPANSALAKKSRPSSSNAIPQLVSIVAGGLVAVVCGIFVFNQFLQPDQEPKSPERPIAGDLTGQGKSSEGETARKPLLVNSELQHPTPIDHAKMAESVRDQSVWIGQKSMENGLTQIFPFCAGWSPTGSYIVTTGTAVQILQKKPKNTVVVFSHLLRDSESGGFVDVEKFWIHPQFSDGGVEDDVGVIQLPMPLPLQTAKAHHTAGKEEWVGAFNRKLSGANLRCGYLIQRSESGKVEPVSSISMPEYAWGVVDRFESLSGNPLSHPVIKIEIPATLPKLHGHAVVSANGAFLGTLFYNGPGATLLIPVDRLDQFTP